MQPKFIIIHHSAVNSNKNSDQFKANNEYHKKQCFPISSFNFYLGYHFEISKIGKVYQARKNNEVGAHCKEIGMNSKSIGICLDGNFDEEKFDGNQVFALRDLLKKLTKELNLTKDNIYFHRTFADYKSCPGKNIDLCFVRSLI